MNPVMKILSPFLGEDLAEELISYRNSLGRVKEFDSYRAKITLSIFLKSPDPKLAAWEYMNRSKNAEVLSSEYMKSCLSYDPSTGIFTRRIYRGHKSLPGTEINSIGSHGYIEACLSGRLYLAHRLAWFHETGEWPEYVDHIDRNKLNNRIDNLRSCTVQENNWNLPDNPRNTSGIRGVSWDRPSGKWMATIRGEGKTRYLGKFEDKNDAAKAYEDAVARYRGHFLEKVL